MMQRPSDELLVAYLDGEVEETVAIEVESWLEQDPDLRIRLQALTESATHIRDAFEEILREPVRRAEARLALEEVRRAAARLPAEQREALMLVTVDGFSYKEAAEIAQVPVGTIMSRLARARVALVAQLDAGGGLRRSGDDAAAQR